MKQLKTAGVLLAVLLILGGVAYWDEQQTASDELAKKSEKKAFDLAIDDIREFHYLSPEATGQLKIVAKLKDGQWQLSSPVDAIADGAMIKRLLETLTQLKYQRVAAEAPTDLQPYGITDTSREIVMITADRQYSLHIGGTAPVGFSVYFKKDGDPRVYLASQILQTATAKKLRDFRSKSLADIPLKKLIHFEYEKKDQDQIVLEKKADQFVMSAPKKVRADKDEVEDLIFALNGLKVENFVDSPGKDLQRAFLKTDLIVRWTLADRDQVALRFVEFDGGYWASYDPLTLAYRLPEEVKKKLSRTFHKLRDRSLLDNFSETIVSIEVDGDKFDKVDDKWFLKTQDKTEQKPKSHIRDLIIDMEFAKADKMLPTNAVSSIATKAPLHRVTVNFEKSKTLLELWVNEKDSGQYYVRSSGRSEIMLTAAKNFENLKEKQVAVIDKKSTSEQ